MKNEQSRTNLNNRQCPASIRIGVIAASVMVGSYAQAGLVGNIVADELDHFQVDFVGDINPVTGVGGEIGTVNTANWGEVSLRWNAFFQGISFELLARADHERGPHGHNNGPQLNWFLVAPNPLRENTLDHTGHSDIYTVERVVDGGPNNADIWRFKGVHTPTPGSFALLGLGGIVATRRRRR